jgi:site-specific DNA-adenine methylase
VYWEPFAGSAAVFLAEDPAKIETINDINGDLVAFMRTLRDQPRALQRAIQLTRTPAPSTPWRSSATRPLPTKIGRAAGGCRMSRRGRCCTTM